MSWVKVDDQAWSHPKIADLSGNAVRLWLFALCWANSHETDGFITRGGLKLLGGRPKDVRELVEAGLWVEHESGWEIHNFLKYQPSKAQRNAQRDATAERVRRARSARGSGDVTPLHRANTGVSNEHVRIAPARPGPARPVPNAATQLSARGGVTNLETALKVPIAERCRATVEAPHTMTWTQPHKWPEVISLLERFAEALRWTKPRLLKPEQARVAIELLAAFGPEELDRAIAAAPGDPWLASPGKGPSCLTVEVVGRLLTAASQPARAEPKTADDVKFERAAEAKRREIAAMKEHGLL